MIFLPLLVLKGIYDYYTYFCQCLFSSLRGLQQSGGKGDTLVFLLTPGRAPRVRPAAADRVAHGPPDLGTAPGVRGLDGGEAIEPGAGEVDFPLVPCGSKMRAQDGTLLNGNKD